MAVKQRAGRVVSYLKSTAWSDSDGKFYRRAWCSTRHPSTQRGQVSDCRCGEKGEDVRYASRYNHYAYGCRCVCSQAEAEAESNPEGGTTPEVNSNSGTIGIW